MGLKDTARSIRNLTNGKPTIIEVCTGSTLSTPMQLNEYCTAYPLSALSNDGAIAYGSKLLNALGIRTDDAFYKIALTQGSEFYRACMIVVHGHKERKELLDIANKARTLLSFYLATELTSILRIQWIGGSNQATADFLPPRSVNGLSGRHPLDPVNEDFLRFCMHEREDDQRLHYFIGLLEQCQGLFDERLKISRLYSLLESLAAPIISQFSRQSTKGMLSRTSIRYMLGYFLDMDIPRFTLQNPNEDYEFDHIELAGQLRDKIFHGGGTLSIDGVSEKLKPGVLLLQKHPRLISHCLRKDCERAIVEWAKREGRAWSAAEGTQHEIPPKRVNYEGRRLSKPLLTAMHDNKSPIASLYIQVEGLDIGLVRLSLEQ